LVLPIILSLGFDIRFPSVLSETDRAFLPHGRRMLWMALSVGPAGRTFAPASATTRSVVTPESASNPFRRSEIPDHEPSQQPRGTRRLAAPNVLFGSSRRASVALSLAG
jgi:hypothetical protein